MKRLLGVLVGLALAVSAEAGIREQEVNFLRWNRGTDVNVAARVSGVVTTVTLAASKTDTTSIINVKDLLPPGGGTSAGQDSNRVVARLIVVSDSSSGGDLTAATVACHCVLGDTRATSVNPTSVAMVTRAYTTMGSKRAYSFPVVQNMTPAEELESFAGDPSVTGGILLCPAMRFVFSSLTGTLGKVRAKLVYYSDQ